MSKSSMLKEGMKGGLNGLLSSTKKPSKEQIVTETTPAPPVSVSETTEVAWCIAISLSTRASTRG